MIVLDRIQIIIFKFRRLFALALGISGIYCLRVSALPAGFFMVIALPVWLWGMKLHPDADTDRASFAARKWVRVFYMIACGVGLIAALYLALFSSEND